MTGFDRSEKETPPLEQKTDPRQLTISLTSSGLGLADVNYKRNLDIVQQDRDGTTLRRWSLSRAWPVKFVAGDWDNESDENVIESVTLTYDFFEVVQ